MEITESNQEDEIEKPRYFYKYRSFNDQHLELLKYNKLYFPSPNKFDDPFDCRIPIRYDLEPSEERKYLFWKHFNETHYPNLSPSEIEELTKSTLENIRTKPNQIHEASLRLSETFRDKHIGVFCVCDDYRNILLWSHYSDLHKGFLVAFDAFWLSAFCAQYQIFRARVKYDQQYPILNPYTMDADEILRGGLCTKSDNWLYQHEYRLIWPEGANQSLEISGDLIKRVILGCEMSNVNRDSIIDILKNREDHPSLFQAKKANDSFSLCFTAIRY